MTDTKLAPCPFCGGAASKSAYDRGIDIGCEPCGYSRHFPGLLQTIPNDKPIAQYRNGDGGITEIPVSEATEFYHSDANERAAEVWNRRAATKAAAPADAPRMTTEVLLKIVAENTGRRINLSMEDLDLYLAVAREAIRRVSLPPRVTPEMFESLHAANRQLQEAQLMREATRLRLGITDALAEDEAGQRRAPAEDAREEVQDKDFGPQGDDPMPEWYYLLHAAAEALADNGCKTNAESVRDIASYLLDRILEAEIARRASTVPAIPGKGREEGWIAVSDRLPPKYEEVIVWPHPTDYCMTAELYGESASGNPVWKYGEYVTGFGHETTEMTRPVTHWMPRPTDPSEAKSGEIQK